MVSDTSRRLVFREESERLTGGRATDPDVDYTP